MLTDTTRLHAAAWKSVFDALLQQLAERQGRKFRPFDIDADYLAYVDGRPRYDGVRTFLTARGIVLPEGSADDPEFAETIHAIGMHKTHLFRQALQKGIDPAPGALSLLRRLRQADIGIAVASSSENCAIILRAAGLDHLIDQRVDGRDADKLGLEGKPNPALFLEAARRLRLPPLRAIVFEDALAGVGLAGWGALDEWLALIAAHSRTHCVGMALLSSLKACYRFEWPTTDRGFGRLTPIMDGTMSATSLMSSSM